MWLSRSLYNPYNLVRGGYSAPYYLANTLGWNAAYAVGQGFNAGKKNQANSINQMKMFGQQGVVDQIAPAKWAAAQNQNQQQAFQAPDLSSSAPALLAPETDPFFMPVPMSIDTSSSPQVAALAPQTLPIQQSEAGTIPAPAPDFRGTNEKHQKHKKQKKQKKENKGLAEPNSIQEQLPEQPGTQTSANSAMKSTIETATTPKNNPFANAFVEHVNAKFGSDINKAFSDKETCGYAEAMGLIDDRNKSITIQPDRVELIRHILQDPAEDSLTKVNTIRMLIKH